MDAFEVTELPAARRAVFVTSTMGQGDPPSNARSFWKFLLRKSLPEDSLRRLSFACFGLGDSHYAKFNVAAKKLHRRLERLGATSVVALGLGDDQHPAGYDHALDPWLAELWKALRSEPLRSDDSFTKNAVSDACRFAVFQETAASRFDEAVDAPPSVETLLRVIEKFDALAERPEIIAHRETLEGELFVALERRALDTISEKVEQLMKLDPRTPAIEYAWRLVQAQRLTSREGGN